MSYTAKDVSSLRQSTGAGMMDCKKALEESGGDIEAAKQWLREKGLAASAKRDDRDNAQGVVSIIVDGARASIVKLKCETDFVASSLKRAKPVLPIAQLKLTTSRFFSKRKLKLAKLFVSKLLLATSSIHTHTSRVVVASTVSLLK
jgi:translation elongation factor Ts